MKIKEIFTLYKKRIITYAWKSKSIYKKLTTKWFGGGEDIAQICNINFPLLLLTLKLLKGYSEKIALKI
jgi:hypothetical protein